MSLWTQAAAHTGASSGRAPAHLVAQPIASVTHLIVQSRTILWLSRAVSGSASPVSEAEAVTKAVAMRRRRSGATAMATPGAYRVVARAEAMAFSGLWLFGAFRFCVGPCDESTIYTPQEEVKLQ